jgi:hypothetical protein
MHIKAKTTVEGAVYYVCYSYQDGQVVPSYVTTEPKGINKLFTLSKETIKKIAKSI